MRSWNGLRPVYEFVVLSWRPSVGGIVLRSCLLVLQFIRAADVGALAVAPNLAASFSRIIDASGEAQ